MKHGVLKAMGTHGDEAVRGRRAFVVRSVTGACAGAVLPWSAWAAPAHVEESDDTAVQLGYRHNTREVDLKTYPKHVATQRCGNCSFFQGTKADAWAGCAMFGRKQVALEGWCKVWVPVPG